MLVIRRKLGEALLIEVLQTPTSPPGNAAPMLEVEVEVLELTATRVVLGIKAPAEVRVVRKELLEAAQQNRAAADSAKIFAPAKISSYLAGIGR